MLALTVTYWTFTDKSIRQPIPKLQYITSRIAFRLIPYNNTYLANLERRIISLTDTSYYLKYLNAISTLERICTDVLILWEESWNSTLQCIPYTYDIRTSIKNTSEISWNIHQEINSMVLVSLANFAFSDTDIIHRVLAGNIKPYSIYNQYHCPLIPLKKSREQQSSRYNVLIYINDTIINDEAKLPLLKIAIITMISPFNGGPFHRLTFALCVSNKLE